MMIYRKKTKAGLINELQKLQQQYDSLKASYLKDITERKRVAELLKESMEQLSEAQKLACIGVWDWKPDTDTVTWTDELYRIAGLDPMLPAPTYKEHSSLYTPESWELLKTGVEKAMETGESYKFELELIRPNGDTRYVNAFGGAKFDSKGKVNGLFGTVQDITERKQVEKELHFQGEIMKNISEGINLIRVEDEIIVFTNSKFDKMFGYNSEELIGKHVSTLNAFAGKSPEETKQYIVDTVNRTGEWHGEILNIKKTGDHFWCYVVVSVFDHPDYGKVFLSVHSDITERKRAEEALRREKDLAESIIETAQTIILVLDIQGRIVNFNPYMEEISGYSLAEVRGKDWFSTFLPEPSKKETRNLFRKAINDIRTVGNINTILTKDGNELEIEWYDKTLKDMKGNVVGLLSIGQDITKRKLAEKEIIKSKKLLEDLYKHQIDIRENERALISREIHDELGQSMTAFKLDLNQLHKYVSSNPEAIMKLDSLVELVSNTIKDVQRISSDLRPGIIDDLGLAAAIEWYSDEFEKRTGIKCRLNLDDSIRGDPKKDLIFFRVLQESLTNVIRHANATAVTIELHQTQKGIMLAIKDNGIGIKREEVESTKSLGLIGMRERVRQFGGKIMFSSEEGLGTKLTIFIPEK